ncbi:hypothetical protein BH09SUM1_BH09SUM1_17910 [soil metagenome]
MPAILLFSREPYALKSAALSETMTQALGVSCFPCKDGERIAEFDAAEDGSQAGAVSVDLPDLEEDEGKPIVNFEVAPRLDRDESIQKMVDEIVEQENSLSEEINNNTFDFILTFDDTPAAVEAGSVLAYIIAGETDSGILIPGFTDEDDTVWFDNAEDFADAVFGDETEDGDDEGEEPEEDGE